MLGCVAGRSLRWISLRWISFSLERLGLSEGSSSTGRAPVSKTGGWGFESLLPCVLVGSDGISDGAAGIIGV